MLPFQGEMNEQKSELPENDLNFHGRKKEIDEIVQVLSGERDKRFAGVLVNGTAGIGKSAVAIQAGHRLKNEFVVKCCSLRGAYKGRNEDNGVLREILNVCVPDHQQGSEYPKHVLLNWCRRLGYKLVLVVDDVEDAIGDQGDYPFLNLVSDMRMCSQCKIKFLVTSRHSDISGAGSNIQFDNKCLDPLDVKESIEVLKNGAHLTSDTDTDTEVKLREIAELCENIPLALRLAGPLLAEESEYTFEGLKKKLEQNPAKTLGAEKMMEIAFEKLDDSLKRALVRLSVFPRSFKRDAAKAILRENYDDDLTNLKKRCLIQKQDDRYLIHLLIRSYAKQVGKKEEFCQILSDGKHGFLRHFLSLILSNARKYWGKDTCKESFILFNEERINLESTLREIAGQKEIQHCSEMEAVMNECQQVAPYIEYCVHFQLYDKFLRGLLQLCQSQGKITKQVEILCLLYHEKRKYSWNYEHKLEDLILQAKELHDGNLSHFERDRLSEAFYLNHYGRYLSEDRNEREQAQPLLKQAISIYEKERTRFIAQMGHNAKYEERPLLKQAISIHEKELNINDSTFDIGRIYVQMGHNLNHGERYEEALNSYTEALRFRSSRYGKHILTAFAHKDLADYHFRLGNFPKAEESYKEAIQLLKDIEMDRQKEAVSVYRNYGKCCEERGKIEEARQVLETGRDIATMEGSVRVKVELNTSLALLLYKKYRKEVKQADKLAKKVFEMNKELKMDEWPEITELGTFYKRNDTSHVDEIRN